MARNRVPFDVARLQKKVTNCFICDFLAGSSRYPHHVVAETDSAVAFLNRFPTLFGYVLVAPKEHREQVTGDFDEEEYIDLQRFIFRQTPSQTVSTPRSSSSDIENASESDRRLERGFCIWASFRGSLRHFWLTDSGFRILVRVKERPDRSRIGSRRVRSLGLF